MAAKYEVDEIVCVKDRGKFYEAKIINMQLWSDTWHYFVHFQGWNKKWDRWTEESEMAKKTSSIGRNGMKDEDDNEIEEEDVKHSDEVEGSEVGVSSRGVKRGRGRKSEPEVKKQKQLDEENLEEYNDETSMLKLQIPLTLKKRLMDEWELISKKPFRVLKLPRPNTVSTIIAQYLHDRKTDLDQEEKVSDLFQCLLAFFDRALPLILLYRQEQRQYEQLSQEVGFLPSKVYGPEHLLRLFVKLPQLFVNNDTNQTELRFIKQKMTEFLKYLQKYDHIFATAAGGDYEPLADLSEVMGETSTSSQQAIGNEIR